MVLIDPFPGGRQLWDNLALLAVIGDQIICQGGIDSFSVLPVAGPTRVDGSDANAIVRVSSVFAVFVGSQSAPDRPPPSAAKAAEAMDMVMTDTSVRPSTFFIFI
jgi:hypothetical protein